MGKYRKKPVVIDAVQWYEHGNHPEVMALPEDEYKKIDGHKDYQLPFDRYGWVETLEGGHIVTPGDWIIKGVHGEFYPCKPDIFEETYEPVDEQS